MLPTRGRKTAATAGALTTCLLPTVPSPDFQGGSNYDPHSPHGDPKAEGRVKYLAQGHRADGAECLGFEPESADS